MSKKKALLIGINYKGTSGQLNGCINDVNDIRNLLISKFKYSSSDIIVLTDDTPKKPTGINIMNELGKLVIKAYHNQLDEIWIHYSGHGSYVRDRNQDEKDGRDEVLVPIDYKKMGL